MLSEIVDLLASTRTDCAMFVCYIIRQYMEGGDIGRTMDGQTPDELRASMVKMFLNDPVRGVRVLGRV
ncbi:hypothetical protein HYC85_024487 [Camellia sinensis]|uniref:Uncharacterized protein n=1 Tax=Camellia sinensis TaxID=4442 RepID=A0A7J7GAM5_CAMSI|nr:hypothetical protein HYC85_024487 [Camellia sinensis]